MQCNTYLINGKSKEYCTHVSDVTLYRHTDVDIQLKLFDCRLNNLNIYTICLYTYELLYQLVMVC